MKGNSKSPVSPLFTLFFILLLLSCLASARVLNQNFEKGDQKLKAADGTANDELMGLDEICGKEGEECTNERKLLAQAHLDYIYTQKHPRP